MERGGVILTIRGGIGTGISATIPTAAGGVMVGILPGTMVATIRIGVGARDTIRRITAWVVRLTTDTEVSLLVASNLSVDPPILRPRRVEVMAVASRLEVL